MVRGLACAQICTLWRLKIPSRVNITSSVNNSFDRNCGCQTPLAKSYTARQILRLKTLYTLQMTWIQWFSCSILQTVLRRTPSAEDILGVIVPGLTATWARIRCSCCTVLAVRGPLPSITGMNVSLSCRRCAMHENFRLHGSRRFGNVSWYKRLASHALQLARP